MIGDVVFMFIRFAYTLILKGPGHSKNINAYLDSSQAKDNALIFWLFVGNILAVYIIYKTEKEYHIDKK